MATRLTNRHRRQIAYAVINHKFEKQQHTLDKAEAKLVERVRIAAFGRKTCEQMDSLPEDFLPTYATFCVYTEGDWRETIDLRTTCPFRFGAGMSPQVRAKDLPKQLSERVRQHHKACTELDEKQSQLHRDVLASLSQFQSLETLHRMWPEMKPFTKGIEPAAKKLPTVRVDDLNKQLGLTS